MSEATKESQGRETEQSGQLKVKTGEVLLEKNHAYMKSKKL